MATYIILNIIVLSVALVALRIFTTLHWNKSLSWLLVLLLALTALFDSLIIVAGIVAYDTDKILGLMVGFAPIEDFFYAILVVIMIPAIWKKLDTTHAR